MRLLTGCLEEGFGLFSRRSFLVLLAFLLTTGPRSSHGAETVSKEYQVKAAFLYNFTKFVEWPRQSFARTNSPIVIAVLGRNPFGNELEKIVLGRSVDGHPVEVRHITSSQEAASAHLLFVSSGGEEQWAGTIKSLQKAAVLTVGESPEFVELGGIINFILEGNKIRFEVNQDAVDDAGLKVNAQLLKLATAVRRKPKGL